MDNQAGTEAKVDVGNQGSTEVSSAPIEKSNGQSATPSVNGDAQKTPQETTANQNIPFGDKRHPEYKRFKELTESNREYKQKLSQFEREMAELRGFKESMLAQRGQGAETIAPEQKQALLQLFQMGLSVPEVKDMIAKSYGLDRLDEVHKGFSSFKDTWEGQQYQAEMTDVRKTATDMGLDPDEVEQELQDHVNTNPFYADKNYHKGAVKAIFRDLYFDRVGELRERADNKKKIEERDRLKNGQVQSAAESSNKADAALPKEDNVRRNVEIIKRAGGLEKLPFFR